MTYILGLNAYHWDSSACLLRDGDLIAAVAEERLGDRVKHKAGFPSRAINSVLEIGGISVGDVDYLAIGYDKNANARQKLAYAVTNPLRTAKLAAKSLGRRAEMSGFKEKVAEACGVAGSRNADSRPFRWNITWRTSPARSFAARSTPPRPFPTTRQATSRPLCTLGARGSRIEIHRARVPAALAGLLLHRPVPVHRIRPYRRGIQGHGVVGLWQAGVYGPDEGDSVAFEPVGSSGPVRSTSGSWIRVSTN